MIYTVTFNPSLDYIVGVDEFKTGKVNRTAEELILPGGKGINVSIEEDISVLETTIETLDQEMAENGTDYVKLRELSEKKDEAEEQLMEKMERWEYLEELAEKIANQ